MTLLYRAIWQDDWEDLLEAAMSHFERWVATKDLPEGLPADPGHYEFDSHEIIHETGSDETGSIVRLSLVEDRHPDLWTTRMTVIELKDEEGWLWVDVERESSNAFERPDIAAPRLVRQLLDSSPGHPHCGPVDLASSASRVSAEDADRLVNIINNESRETPIVVVSYDSDLGTEGTEARARTTAEILAGVASVAELTPLAVPAFHDEMGKEMAVWGGAVRIYLPESQDKQRPYRHRFLPRSQIAKNLRAAGRTVARMLSGSVSARRPPSAYGLFAFHRGGMVGSRSQFGRPA